MDEPVKNQFFEKKNEDVFEMIKVLHLLELTGKGVQHQRATTAGNPWITSALRAHPAAAELHRPAELLQVCAPQ